MASDLYYLNVKLLLRMDGANGGTTFTDSSTTNTNITPVGSVTTSTARFKYGTASALFNGTNARLTANQNKLILGTKDFTIELWAYLPSTGQLSSFPTLFQLGPNSNDNNLYICLDSTGVLLGESNLLVQTPIGTPAPVSTDTWHHIAFVRSGTTYYLWLDGVLYAQTTLAITHDSGQLYIGGDDSTNYFAGNIDDVRVTLDYARYTAPFTPPTETFSTSPYTDDYFPNLSLFMHCDSSADIAKNATVTPVNGASFSSPVYKFGSSALALNGSNQYIAVTYTDPSNYSLGTGQYTVEFWVYMNSVSPGPFFIGNWGFSGSRWGFYYDSSNTRLLYNLYGVGFISATWNPSINTWYALAFDRDASNVHRFYVNGTMIGKSTITGNSSQDSPIRLGFPTSSDITALNGYMDEIRITKGVARYASDAGYTVATGPFQPLDSEVRADAVRLSRSASMAIPRSVTDTLNLSRFVFFVNKFELAEGVVTADYAVATIPTLRALTDGSRFGDITSVRTGFVVVMAETTEIAENFATYIYRVAEALDQFYAVDTATAPAKFYQTSTESPSFASQLLGGYPVSLTSGVGIAETIRVVQALRIAEALRLDPVLVAGAKYKDAFSDTIKLIDALRRFFAGDIIDGVATGSTLSSQYRTRQTLLETLGVQQTQSSKMVFRLTADDTVNLDDVDVLKMIFQPVVGEGIEIAAAYIAPDGNLTTWAVNTETGAVTEYTNYGFNSFAQMGHKFLGASSDGLYELNGDDDAGDDIISVIKSGLAQFGGSRFTMFKAAYMGVRGGGEYVLRLETGDGRFYDYNVIAQDMQTTKVRLGKGLRARYFSFELTSTGQDFDLDSVEFVPLVAQRRV